MLREKIRTLSFSPTPFTEYEEIQAWHLQKNFAADSTGQHLKYCKETVKLWTVNVFTVKQLTICPGWLLRKTILEGLHCSGNFVLQEIGSRRTLHQGWKWAFKKRLEFSRSREKHATTSLVSRVHYTSFYLFSLSQIIFFHTLEVL